MVAVRAPSRDEAVTVSARNAPFRPVSSDRHVTARAPSHPPGTIPRVFHLSLDAPTAGAARLRLSGHLDSAAARQVLHAAADVVKCGCSSLVVDMAELESFEPEAAYAVVGCSKLSRYVPEGVAVLTGSEASEALADTAGVPPHPAEAHAPGTMVPCPAC